MSAVPFVYDFDDTYATAVEVAPSLVRVLANNPSKFTFRGTGTYLVGTEVLTIVDPGPADDNHVAALVDAIGGREVSHILITHTHGDHSPAAAAIKELTSASTVGHGPHPANARSEEADADDDATDHNDYDFVPDIAVRDGATIATPAGTFECLHTPGHISNHLCFAWNETKALFTGDHVMGWSTTVIPAPDGDMAAYLDNLERLLDRDDEVYWPTHGPPVTETKPFVEALLQHRRSREQQILELLDRGEATVAELVAVMYADVDEKLHKPAAGSVTSHLTALVRTGRVSRSGDRYALVS